MKICRKCKKEYKDDYSFCPKCGKSFNNNNNGIPSLIPVMLKYIKKVCNIIGYIIGTVILLGNIDAFFKLKFHGLLGILFGLSLLPIINDKIFEIKKVKENKFINKFKKVIQVIVPIVLGIFWIIFIPEEKLEFIKINDSGHIIAVSENYEIDFDTNLSEINKGEFEYISSNPDVASVDNGIINGKTEGTVLITIKGQNQIKKTAEYQIKYVDINELKIKGNTKILVGKKAKLVVETKPKKVSDKIVKWESSNSEIISIDNEGNIIANNKGTATITATTEKGKKATIDIKAYIEISSMTFSASQRVEKNKSITLNLNILPENADIEGITWSSDNNDIAKVENGIVTGLSEGKATITAKSMNGLKATTEIEVYEVKPQSISLNTSSVSLSVGQTATITANISPYNASDKSISWSSSNYSVASVENGIITAKNIGKTTITASTVNGKKATVEVTVTKKAPIKINNFRYTKDSACGVEWTFSITNNSGKTINYITLKWYNFNAVGDFVYDEIGIGYKNYMKLRYTGPLNAGANTGSKRNTTKFYNCSYNSSAFSDVMIEYADGTVENITASDMNYYTNLY